MKILTQGEHFVGAITKRVASYQGSVQQLDKFCITNQIGLICTNLCEVQMKEACWFGLHPEYKLNQIGHKLLQPFSSFWKQLWRYLLYKHRNLAVWNSAGSFSSLRSITRDFQSFWKHNSQKSRGIQVNFLALQSRIQNPNRSFTLLLLVLCH